MSLYSVTTAMKDKIKELHNKLVDETNKFWKNQTNRPTTAEQGAKKLDDDLTYRQKVNFASEIPEERPQQRSNIKSADDQCELQCTLLMYTC